MLYHQVSFNKLKKIEIISSIFSTDKWYETRNQLQEENWKNHIYVEMKQHAFEGPIGQRRNLETNDDGNILYQNLIGCSKSSSRGKFIAINAYRQNKDFE